MSVFGHLTKKQLSDYSLGSIAESALHEVGRHLLGCESCRAELPPPTPGQFRRALLNESTYENDELGQGERAGLFATLSNLTDAIRRQPTLAWTGAALLVLLGLSLMVVFNGSLRPTNNGDVARSFETNRSLPKLNVDEDKNPVQTEINVTVGGPPNSKLSGNNKQAPMSNVNRQPLTSSSQNLPVKKAISKLAAAQENIATTRGASSTCGDQKSIGFEFAATSESILLKWGKVPKAVKYHLYISDEEEILVDEYETSRETSYILKKTLDEGKVYKWKVVIELENGQTLIGVTQKFTSKDFQPSSKGTVKKLRAEIRCSSSN